MFLLFAVGALLVWLKQLRRLGALMAALPRRLTEQGYLAAVLVIVAVVPGAILYFASNVRELIRLSAGGAHGATVALVAICVQGVVIAGASALPILLYFVFDRERLRTLRSKFTRQIFRLDPSIHTLRDIDAKYGEFLDEAYGRQGDNRLLPGRRAPILMATGVMSLGWTVALADTNAVTVAKREPGSLASLLAPSPTAATYAFLGAYFFALNLVLRGFVRGDLRPKTYATVATRTVGVVVLAFVLQRLVGAAGGHGSSSILLALAFVAGLVPETVLVRLQEVAQTTTRTGEGRRALSRFARTYEAEPLTELEGIDIYDRARLLDEGVSNVESLAHHDLVELLLKARIPASRLVDWVDQAILYIHCTRAADAASKGKRVLDQLKARGIRTATELMHAWKAASARNEEEKFLELVAGPRSGLPVLRTVLDAITQEEWLSSLHYWHEQEPIPRLLRVPEDFEGERSPFGRKKQKATRAQAASARG